jgi:prolyl-tRNA synthetase
MRWSRAFIPTLRDDPADADAVSHRLLIRAGFIRQLAAGHYTMLPLGQRTRLKIIDIIRDEMAKAGGQEVQMPVVHPAELWERSGRSKSMADILFRFTWKEDRDIVLGPTEEEVVTPLAKSELRSYKDLPQILWQVHTKLRDEARPKSGLMRVREFTMKDSYSFDIDEAGLDESYEAHRKAYVNFYERIGLRAIPVEASSGAMGGKASVEFMAETPGGEDDIVLCDGCGYSANVEKATSTLNPIDDGPDGPAIERFDTPGVRTIKALEDFAKGDNGGAPADRQIKTLVMVLDGQITLVLMRGDHELVEQKLLDATGANQARPATPEEIRPVMGASPGSLGAITGTFPGAEVLDLPILADEALRGRYEMTTGGNVDDVHYRHVNVERDIAVTKWANLRLVKASEACPHSGDPLRVLHTSEVGHIFKLGQRYSSADAFDMTVLGADGQAIHPQMGCYGIGIERCLSVIVEQNYDDKGIIWPVSVAPYHVAVVPLNADNDEVMGAANILYDELTGGGIETIIDDRDARAGVKLSDVELIGIPVRVAIGKRGIANRTVEVTVRRTGETIEVPLADAAEKIDELLASLS